MALEIQGEFIASAQGGGIFFPQGPGPHTSPVLWWPTSAGIKTGINIIFCEDKKVGFEVASGFLRYRVGKCITELCVLVSSLLSDLGTPAGKGRIFPLDLKYLLWPLVFHQRIYSKPSRALFPTSYGLCRRGKMFLPLPTLSYQSQTENSLINFLHIYTSRNQNALYG